MYLLNIEQLVAFEIKERKGSISLAYQGSTAMVET